MLSWIHRLLFGVRYDGLNVHLLVSSGKDIIIYDVEEIEGLEYLWYIEFLRDITGELHAEIRFDPKYLEYTYNNLFKLLVFKERE